MGPRRGSYDMQHLEGSSKFRWLTFELLLNIFMPRISVLGIIYLYVRVLLIIHM